MAAQKARTLLSVTRANYDGGPANIHVRVRNDYGAEQEIRLSDLPRPELMALVGRMGTGTRNSIGDAKSKLTMAQEVAAKVTGHSSVGEPWMAHNWPNPEPVKRAPRESKDEAKDETKDEGMGSGEWWRDVRAGGASGAQGQGASGGEEDERDQDQEEDQDDDEQDAQGAAGSEQEEDQDQSEQDNREDQDAQGQGQGQQSTGDRLTDVLLHALKVAAETAGSDAPAPLDEERVREIAQEVADDAVSKVSATGAGAVTIKLPGRVDVTLKGERVHKVFKECVTMCSQRVWPMLVGPAGSGKTTLADQVARALNLPFGAISIHPQLPASQLFGYNDATGNYNTTVFRTRYEQGGVFLFDELDNGHPGVLAGINQALANGECAFADGMVKRHEDFIAIGAANTFGTGPTAEYVGRAQLDAATLDRFARLETPYDEGLETDLTHAILEDETAERWLAIVRGMRRNVETNRLRVIVSPRTSIDGAKLIRAGFTMKRAAEVKVLAGLVPEQARKVTEGVTFR